MLRIAVLLTCHNRKEKTLNCLSNLNLQQGINEQYTIKTYLVDDGSTDGTGAAVKSAFPDVKVIQGDGTLFWNRGMYTAWETAAKESHDVYLWLNDDTDLYPSALLEMLDAAKETGYRSIISGCIESPTNKGERVYAGVKREGKQHILNYPDGNINECDIINGNCVLVPQSVYEKVGNLDPRFSHALGDHDYSLRAKKLGIASYTTPRFVASCAPNEGLPKWRRAGVALPERLKNLYSPLSYSHPYEFFMYEKAHFGLVTALKHFFSIHLRVFFPGLK